MDGRRWWRLEPLSRNPLMRPVDRVEGVLFVFAVLLIVAAVPFAFAFGSVSYATQRAAAVAATAERYPSTAVLLADAPRAAVPAEGYPASETATVKAVWQLPDGSERTGTVSADRGAMAGDRVPIWLDRGGDAVAPPPKPSDAVVVGITVAFVGWLTFAALVTGGFAATRVLLERHRRRWWEREWAALRVGHSQY